MGTPSNLCTTTQLMIILICLSLLYLCPLISCYQPPVKQYCTLSRISGAQKNNDHHPAHHNESTPSLSSDCIAAQLRSSAYSGRNEYRSYLSGGAQLKQLQVDPAGEVILSVFIRSEGHPNHHLSPFPFLRSNPVRPKKKFRKSLSPAELKPFLEDPLWVAFRIFILLLLIITFVSLLVLAVWICYNEYIYNCTPHPSTTTAAADTRQPPVIIDALLRSNYSRRP